MAQRPGHIGREGRGPAEPALDGAPPVAARLGPPGDLGQQPVLAGQPAAQPPPPAQRVRQPHSEHRVAGDGPGQHLAGGGVLGVQPPGRGGLAAAGLQPGRGLLGHPQRVGGQRGGYGVLLAGLGAQSRPVGSQRFQHHVPGPAIDPGARRDQQRAVHQPQHREPAVRPGDRLGALQRERPREHRQRPERPPLILVQQLIAPFHRGGQGPLPGRSQPVPAGQQREPVIQAGQQLAHPQRLHPGRGQLDRQRHPVQPAHQPRHLRPGLAIQRKVRVGLPGPVREQHHRLGPGRISQVIRIGHRQRAQPVPRLLRHPQRLPAGGQDPQVIAGRHQLSAQPGRGAEHVLAVIQHQQQLLDGPAPGPASPPPAPPAAPGPPAPPPPPPRPAPDQPPSPARPATPRQRTGPPADGRPPRPAGSSPRHPDRSPSPAGTAQAAP